MESIENNQKIKIRFDFKSFLIFLLIFVVEVLIALFVTDMLIRPYGGDVLVVIMMYYFVKTFVATKPHYIAISVLLFAYVVEFAQSQHLVEKLSLQDNALARTVIGSSFSWIDILAYTLGALICYFIDRKSMR